MKFYLLYIFIFFNLFSFSQKEANIWYFGIKAGVNFNTNPPSVLLDNSMNHMEPAATISDSLGNLLFYSNGVIIKNATHNTLINGSGIDGNTSSANGAIIIPKPNSKNIYYLFTTGYGGGKPLKYNTIDMNGDGGLGEVIEKNVQIHPYVTEPIAATKHKNGRDIWVIAMEQGNNTYVAYLVTENGINTTPIKSSIGTVSDWGNCAAPAKFSPNGKLFAIVHGTINYTAEVFKFNNETGQLFEQILKIDKIGSDIGYGIEFSPNNSTIYLSTRYNLYQYNLLAGNGSQTDILNSRITLFNDPGGYIYGLQLAPDKKIYVSITMNSYISVINNPDIIGTSCDFVKNAIYLGGGTKECNMGLTNFISNYFKYSAPEFTITKKCYGDSTMFTFADTVGIDSVLWNFNDPTTGVKDTSTKKNTYHIYSSVNTFNPSVIIWHHGTVDTISKTIIINEKPILELGANKSFCSGKNYLIDAGSGFQSYLWSDASTNETLTVNTAGDYSLTVTNEYGCSATDFITVEENPNPTPQASSNSAICDGENLNLTSVNTYSQYSWTGPNTFSSSEQNPNILNATINNTGTYSLTVTDNNNCTGTTTTNVTINSKPNPIVGSNSPLCFGNTLNLTCNINNAEYNWSGPNTFSSSDQNPSILNTTINNAGTYSVTVTDNNNCVGTSSATVSINSSLGVIIGSNSPVCDGKTLTFTNNVSGGTYNWSGPNTFSSSEQNPSIINATLNKAGTYSVTVTNSFNCTGIATTNVIVNQNPIPQASSNSAICEGETLNLTSVNTYSQYNWTGPNTFNSSIKNPTISNTTINNGGTYTLTVTDNNNCTGITTTNVNIKSNPTLIINSNAINCEGKDIDLTCNISNAQYNWEGPNTFSSSEQNPIILSSSVLNSGTYNLTVTNTNGCSRMGNINLTINPQPTANFNYSINCLNNSISFTDLSLEQINLWHWDFGDEDTSNLQNPTHEYNNFDNYTIKLLVETDSGCKDSSSITLSEEEYSPISIISAMPAEILRGEESVLTSTNNANYTYTWEPKESLNLSTIYNPTAKPEATTTYTLTITDNNNCKTTKTIEILVKEKTCAEPNIVIPNVFTPNRDCINDLFEIKNENVVNKFSITIYNRWGKKVFETTDINEMWDGTIKGNKATDGVYFYSIEIECFNGETFQKSGNIILIR